jgi:tetratricopeptide (TPR) repeat protein
MRSQRLKKRLRRTGRIVLVLPVVLTVFIVEENVRGRIMLTRYKAELRAKGEKLTLEELNLPKPPRTGNGAAELLAAADEIQSLCQQQHAGSGRERATEDEEEEFNAEHYLPEVPLMLAPGRAVVRHQQNELLAGPFYPQSVVRVVGAWEELSAALTQATPALQRAKLALGLPAVQVELDYTRGLELQLSHLQKLRILSRWFAKDAVLKLREGRVEEALESLTAIARLNKVPEPECVLISQLVRASIATALFNTCWETLQADGLRQEQLEQLQRICELDDFTPPLECCFEFERASWVQMIEHWRRNALKEQMRTVFRPSEWNGWQWRELVRFPSEIAWWIGWLDQDYRRGLQLQENALTDLHSALAAPSWSDARRTLPTDGWVYEARGPYNRWRWKLSSSLVGTGWRTAIRKAFQAQTQREMLRTAIALKRHKLRHGELPPKLDTLVPDFLPRVPYDYMDGQPLRYRLNSDGSFVLYSAGEDGADDGGDPTPRTGQSFLMWSGRDAVWPQPVTPP